MADDIFRKAMCIAWHVIPSIPNATETIGSALTMKSIASLQLKDPTYSGKATTTREYITESSSVRLKRE